MILVKLKGGLGNQMFQYACGRAISLRSGRPLYLDLSNYGAPAENETSREYTLYRFNIVGDIRQDDSAGGLKNLVLYIIKKSWAKAFKKYNIGFNQQVFDRLNKRAEQGKDAILDGFWWSENYFKDVGDTIRKDFTLRERLGDVARVAENNIRKVKNTGTRTISIHIRRGDYVLNPETNAYHGVCSKQYYDEGLKTIEKMAGAENTHLFVSSDDIHWVKENMVFPYPTTYISEPGIADYEELILMSQCAHHIIANSSYSWWAAWLNPKPDKIVIAPLKWIQATSDDMKEMLPESWIRV